MFDGNKYYPSHEAHPKYRDEYIAHAAAEMHKVRESAMQAAGYYELIDAIAAEEAPLIMADTKTFLTGMGPLETRRALSKGTDVGEQQLAVTAGSWTKYDHKDNNLVAAHIAA